MDAKKHFEEMSKTHDFNERLQCWTIKKTIYKCPHCGRIMEHPYISTYSPDLTCPCSPNVFNLMREMVLKEK